MLLVTPQPETNEEGEGHASNRRTDTGVSDAISKATITLSRERDAVENSARETARARTRLGIRH